MVCRDVTRGEEARQEIITQTGNQVSVYHYNQQALQETDLYLVALQAK